MTTNPDPSWQKFRKHEKRVRAMLEDPEVTDELLLIGLAVARWVDGLVVLERNERGAYSWNDLLAGLFSADRISTGAFARASLYIRTDLPRYEIPWPGWRAVCMAPMQRREGLCGKSGSQHERFVDPKTGEVEVRTACSRSDHKAWLRDAVKAHRQWVAGQEVATPVQNKGGALERHLPELNWDEAYVQVDSRWIRPPTTPVPPRPTLRLVVDNTQEHA